MGFSANGSLKKAILRPIARGIVGLIRYIVKPENNDNLPPWPITPMARMNQKRMGKNGPNVKEMRMGYRLSTALFHMDDKPMHDMAEYDIGSGLMVRMYRPFGLDEGKPQPAILFFHGGGFVIGDLETHDTTCRYLAYKAGVVVFAVNYRLAPEHKFPAVFEDANIALKWLHQHAKELNIDKRRIGAGGDSAGASIALTLGLEARAKKLNYLWLVYPGVDRELETSSKKKYVKDLFLTTGVMNWFMGHFIPEGMDKKKSVVSPLKSPKLAKLPPTYLMSVGFDPLCDEIKMLATEMKKAKCKITYKHYPRLAHEIFAISGVVPEAKAAIRDAAKELKKLAEN